MPYTGCAVLSSFLQRWRSSRRLQRRGAQQRRGSCSTGTWASGRSACGRPSTELTEEELRPYFALSPVLDGLFSLTSKLFGVTIAKADGEAPVWHSDVQFFKVLDKSGSTVAYFTWTRYSRPRRSRGGVDEPPGGAQPPAGASWRIRAPPCRGARVQPVHACGDKPSLMTFREVRAGLYRPVASVYCTVRYCTCCTVVLKPASGRSTVPYCTVLFCTARYCFIRQH